MARSRAQRAAVALSIAGGIAAALAAAGLWTVQARVRQDNLDRDLIAAVRQTDARRVRQLLDRGANPNARPCVGHLTVPQTLRTLLTGSSRARTRSEPAVIAALSRTFVVDVPNAHPDNTAVVQLLLQHGADPNARDEYGTPALFRALYGDNGETVATRLVEAGADVNATDGQETALTIAARRGDTALARTLLSHGSKADDNYGSDALMQSANSAITRLLLTHGAHPNASKQDGFTPLMHAAMGGDSGSVALLLAHGADPHCRTRYGATALTWALNMHSGRDPATIRLLKRAGAGY